MLSELEDAAAGVVGVRTAVQFSEAKTEGRTERQGNAVTPASGNHPWQASRRRVANGLRDSVD